MVGLVALGIITVGLVLIVDDDLQTARAGSGMGDDSAARRAAAASALLDDLERYLRDGEPDAGALVTADDATAGEELSALAANVRSLRITDLRLKFVADSSVRLSTADRADLGRTAWVGDVALTWRLGGVDRSSATLVVPLVFDWAGRGAVFRTARVVGDRRVPLWLLAPLTVHRSGSGIVVAADPAQLETLVALREHAARTVEAVLPQWHSRPVVEAPATLKQYAATSGLTDPRTGAFAAVTTTADGTRSPESALRVHLDPEVFWGLGPRARQVVLSHEAAHVALRSVVRPVPMWLSEGMADHVALRDSGIPVRTSAAELLALVRREGVPEQLPTGEQLAGAAPDVGAGYEASWLAVRLLADRFGDQALQDFYRVAARYGDTERAFTEVLGTTEDEFVEAWRKEVAALAGRTGRSVTAAAVG